jgi:hypothetical protein
MGEWHRNNPELVGTSADPWMIHEDYRRAMYPRGYDREPDFNSHGLCPVCDREPSDHCVACGDPE